MTVSEFVCMVSILCIVLPQFVIAMTIIFIVKSLLSGPPIKPTPCRKQTLKPGFHMSGKSQTIGDFTASRLSPINIPDRLGWTETNLESRELFYFPDASQISAMVGDHSRRVKAQICTVGNVGDNVGDGFRSLPIP